MQNQNSMSFPQSDINLICIQTQGRDASNDVILSNEKLIARFQAVIEQKVRRSPLAPIATSKARLIAGFLFSSIPMAGRRPAEQSYLCKFSASLPGWDAGLH